MAISTNWMDRPELKNLGFTPANATTTNFQTGTTPTPTGLVSSTQKFSSSTGFNPTNYGADYTPQAFTQPDSSPLVTANTSGANKALQRGLTGKPAADPMKALTIDSEIARMSANDNDVMRMVATKARKDSARRGLINSSMATQAGQAAVLGQVSEWASRNQDAENRARESNMNAQNRANEFSAGLGSDVLKSEVQQGQFNAGLNLDTQKSTEDSKRFGASFNLDKARLAQQQSQFESEQKFRSTLADTNFTQQKELLALKSSFDTTAEGNRMAVSTWTKTLDAVNQINTSELDPAAKTQMIKNQFGNAQGSFNLINKLHKINIPQLLSFE